MSMERLMEEMSLLANLALLNLRHGRSFSKREKFRDIHSGEIKGKDPK